MNQTLLTNIHQLINVRQQPSLLRGKELSSLPILENAWLLMVNGRIADFGTMDAYPEVSNVMDLK